MNFIKSLWHKIFGKKWPRNYSDKECVRRIEELVWNMKFEPSDAEHYTWGHKEDVPKAFLECAKTLEEIRQIISDRYEVG